MGFNFHVGLPGPFSYTKRIRGHRRSRTQKPAPAFPLLRGWAIAVVGLVVLTAAGGLVGALIGLAMIGFMTVVTIQEKKTDA